MNFNKEIGTYNITIFPKIAKAIFADFLSMLIHSTFHALQFFKIMKKFPKFPKPKLVFQHFTIYIIYFLIGKNWIYYNTQPWRFGSDWCWLTKNWDLFHKIGFKSFSKWSNSSYEISFGRWPNRDWFLELSHGRKNIYQTMGTFFRR